MTTKERWEICSSAVKGKKTGLRKFVGILFFFEKREMERYSNYLLLTKITISLEQQKLGLIKTYDKTYVYIYELRNASKFKFIY